MTGKRGSRESDATVNTVNKLSYREKDYLSGNALKNENINDDEIVFNSGSRISIYVLFLIINIVINMDSGNIPAATKEISADLDINDKSLGAFASLVSLGTFFGGIISFSIINSISRKWTVIVANIGACAMLFTFPISNNIFLLYGNRIVMGIFQVSNFKQILFFF
jgi:hypothetical protein